MAIAKKLLKDIETRLNVSIIKAIAVSGGSINKVYCLETTAHKLLLKINDKIAFPNMFKLEKEGLQAIATTKTINVPVAILQEDTGSDSYLVLEWIELGKASAKSSQLLGEQLAAMHRCTAAEYGFDKDNYMGSLPQSNNRHSTWHDFFITERLQPMVKLARYKEQLNARDGKNFEKLYQKLSSLFEEEQPALIHGDLWAGNYLINNQEQPYLIDPAVVYGHREFDIAMTTLFGGFDRLFYEAYHAAYPLQPGWQQRISLWNLYPLLLHVNLFGGNYAAQVRQGLANYI